MGPSNLPAVVLDVLVEFAGYEQGWRLEIASQSLTTAGELYGEPDAAVEGEH